MAPPAAVMRPHQQPSQGPQVPVLGPWHGGAEFQKKKNGVCRSSRGFRIHSRKIIEIWFLGARWTVGLSSSQLWNKMSRVKPNICKSCALLFLYSTQPILACGCPPTPSWVQPSAAQAQPSRGEEPPAIKGVAAACGSPRNSSLFFKDFKTESTLCKK